MFQNRQLSENRLGTKLEFQKAPLITNNSMTSLRSIHLLFFNKKRFKIFIILLILNIEILEITV